MLGIQYHTSPALSRSKQEFALFTTLLSPVSDVTFSLVHSHGFLHSLRLSQFSCCEGSCLNSFAGDVMNRKPRCCTMGARCHLTVSPHKGKMCLQIEEIQQVLEPVAVQISLMGYSWSWQHSQRKVKSWGMPAAITRTASSLLAQGTSCVLRARNFTETSRKPSHILSCEWWLLQDRREMERQLYQKWNLRYSQDVKILYLIIF